MTNKNESIGSNQVSFNRDQVIVQEKNNNEIGYKRLVLMWGLILLGYFLFVVQWYSISNFSGGYGKNIGSISNAALNAMPNWTITLMRGVGSVLAGWLMVKIGHKYSVITVLSLMVLSFPFIIFASISGIGNPTPDGSGGEYYPVNFGMFLFWRLFLAIGGTTLITYTNSVIAKMPVAERPKYLRINQFGFNGGALFANIFFCFGISKVINGGDAWIYILSAFVVLIAILLVMYLIFGKEVVPVQRSLNKNAGNITDANELTFGKVLKQSYTWKMSTIFIVWLVAVVFINSGSMRNVIEQSPANFKALVEWNWLNQESLKTIVNGEAKYSWADAMAKSTLSTNSSVVVGSGYEWVWPTFICMFVSGFFVGLFIIAPFNKTIYKRKFFIHLMFAIGYVFAFMSLMIGYFGGYNNKVALAFFLIFIFISGIFLWSVQPVLLTLYQQCPQASPKYAGIIAGLIWGIGYVGYTVVELLLSVALSYANPFPFAGNIKSVMDALVQANTDGSLTANPSLIFGNSTYMSLAKSTETAGAIIVWIGFAIVCGLVFLPIQMLPPAGIKDKDGNFIPFTKTWKPWEWNFKKKEILIQ
ncbi:permease [Malacoplasma muris]|uniref:permease n=1 Tax=Malacoplasma muris TaxID=2119 RepID=UPI00398F69FC